MSQVLMKAHVDGMPVEVLAGWSRAESQVFVTVRAVDEEGEWRDDVPPLLEAWKHVDNRPTDIGECAVLAAQVQDKLNPLGIVVPTEMLGEIAAHIALDAGNIRTRYNNSGSLKPLNDDSD